MLYLLTSCRKRKMRQKDEERDNQFFLTCSYLSGFSPPGFRANVVQVCLREEEFVGDWLFFTCGIEK